MHIYTPALNDIILQIKALWRIPHYIYSPFEWYRIKRTNVLNDIIVYAQALWKISYYMYARFECYRIACTNVLNDSIVHAQALWKISHYMYARFECYRIACRNVLNDIIVSEKALWKISYYMCKRSELYHIICTSALRYTRCHVCTLEWYRITCAKALKTIVFEWQALWMIKKTKVKKSHIRLDVSFNALLTHYILYAESTMFVFSRDGSNILKSH